MCVMCWFCGLDIRLFIVLVFDLWIFIWQLLHAVFRYDGHSFSSYGIFHAGALWGPLTLIFTAWPRNGTACLLSHTETSVHKRSVYILRPSVSDADAGGVHRNWWRGYFYFSSASPLPFHPLPSLYLPFPPLRLSFPSLPLPSLRNRAPFN